MKKIFSILFLATLIAASTPMNVSAEVYQYNDTVDSEEVVTEEKVEESKEESHQDEKEINNNDISFSGEEVQILDPSLRSIIATSLGLEETAPITESDLSRLVELDISGNATLANQIVSLEGLQFATNLQTLKIIGENISDISPISTLTNLTRLEITQTKTTDISPLADLTNLQYLDLSGNGIVDLMPLQKLTSLIVLNLAENAISDMWPLHTLTDLEQLTLAHNKLRTIEALREMTSVSRLSLDFNYLSDITALEGGASLRRIALDSNQISDISVLQRMPQLSEYTAVNQVITLPDSLLDEATSIVIKTYDGTTPNLSWVTNGQYEAGKLSWEKTGKNQLSFEANNVTPTGRGIYSGTIEQNVNASVILGEVTIKHLDQTGKELVPTKKISGTLGDAYQTQAENIEGYQLVGTHGNATGTYTQESQSVIYLYEKIKATDTTNETSATGEASKADGTSQTKENAATEAKKALPNTGEAILPSVTFGLLSAALGLLFFFKRSRKKID